MRSAELTAFVVLGGFVALLWLGWLILRGGSLWVPVGITALAVLLLLARIVFLSVRQD